MKFTINGNEMICDVVGPTERGADIVLLDGDENLVSGLPWDKVGFTVAPFLSTEENTAIRAGFVDIVREMVLDSGGTCDTSFSLERYHEYVDHTVHMGVVERIHKKIPLERFPVALRRLEERVSEICERPLEMARNVKGDQAFWLRVVRPGMPDNNPLHRDVWIDRLRHNVNIYFPLAGSNARSSLCLVPGSHRWKESEIERTISGSTVNGVAFSVPAVVGASFPIDAIRPDPGANEVLVFSPYLIHGGAVNTNPTTTRVSLEVRFQRPGQARS